MSKFKLHERVEKILRALVAAGKTEQRLARRIWVILYLFEGLPLSEIGRRIGGSRVTVYKWKNRWLQNAELLEDIISKNPSDKDLRSTICSIFSDSPRSGTPATFSPEVITRIVALACEPPGDSGYPISHWSPREIRTEAIKRGIVSDISVRSIGRFLKGGGSQTA